jgi:hypothetical protein
MVEAAIGVLAVLVLGAGFVALRAVLDGLRTGLPASIAVLAPLAEGARRTRSRAVAHRPGTRPVVAAVLLLLAPLVRVVLLALPDAVLWLLAAEALWCGGAVLLAGWRVLLLEPPILAALAAVVVGGAGALPLAAEAPVALVLLLVVGGVLLPWSVQAPIDRLGGAARLLAGAGRALQPVSIAAAGAALLLGTRGGWTWLLAAVLAAVLVIAARRFPVPRPPHLVRLALLVLLPLGLVQLAIVVVLRLLALSVV